VRLKSTNQAANPRSAVSVAFMFPSRAEHGTGAAARAAPPERR
jgi:hypothetical protein